MVLNLVYDDLKTKVFLEDIMFSYKYRDYKLFNIDEINTVDKFYYVISHLAPISVLVNQGEYIPLSVKEKMSSHPNLVVLFLNEHESDHDDAADILSLKLNSDGIPLNQVIISNNNSKISALCQKVGLMGIENHRIFTLYSRDFNFHIHNFKSEKEKLFTCHNRKAKPHRVSTLCYLKKFDILKDTDWSFVRGFEFRETKSIGGSIDSLFFKQILSDDEIENFKNEITYFRNIDIKKSEFEDEFDIDNPINGTINFDLSYKFNSYEHAYINLALETHYEWKNVIHITEKTLKPFYFLQIPVILSTPHHVRELRETYGFDMFDDLIDHSYDEIIDDKERFKKYIQEVIRLHSIKDDVIEFYKKNEDRIMYNRQVINNFYVGIDDYMFFKKLSEL